MAAANKEPALILGPVIGQVSDTTVRVLLEADGDADVDVLLTPTDDAGAEPLTFRAALKRDVPGVCRCTGLLPSTTYDIKFDNVANPDDRTGCVTTYPAVMTRVRVIAAACDKDKSKNRGPINMWERLYQQHVARDAPAPVDLLVHHGDQVYADPEFLRGMRYVADHRGEDEESIVEGVAQIMAGAYRRTWDREFTREVLANVPNVCMWDDHEMRNDWGTFATDRDPSTDDYKTGLGARRAYWRYQRQLWDDVPSVAIPVEPASGADEAKATPDGEDGGGEAADSAGGGGGGGGGAVKEGPDGGSVSKDDSGEGKDVSGSGAGHVSDSEALSTAPIETTFRPEDEVDTETYVHAFPGGKVGLMMVDCRGARSFYYTPSRPYVSEPQWAAIKSALAEDGVLGGIDSLLVVHSSPAVFLGNTCASMCQCLSKDKMGLSLHPGEQREYLDSLVDWKHRREGRALYLVGGDMHFSYRAQVRRGDELVFEQLTTSALSNKPPFWFQYYIFKAIMVCCCTGSGDGAYSYSTSDWYPAQNFGLFTLLAAADGERARVDAELVKSRDVCCDYRGCCYC